MFIVTVEFTTQPEHLESFRAAMLQQAASSLSREAGCRQFDVCVADDDESRVFLYEAYDDRAALDIHLRSDHFRDFDATVTPWIASKTVNCWNLVSIRT